MNILHLTPEKQLSTKWIVIICAAIFLTALSIRWLYWHDNQVVSSDAGATDPYTMSIITAGMPTHYRDNAQLLLSGNVHTFLRGSAPPNDARIIMHPPGYPILTALAFKAFGDSNTNMRLVHLVLTSVAAVLVFLITANLLKVEIAIIAGLSAAFSPQLAFYSAGLRPDILVPLPILLAIYFITRAIKQFRARNLTAAGAFLGLSCWLRSDVMLLAPVLAVAVLPLLFERGKRLRPSLILVCVTALIIVPITIRNLIVFHHFIPVSLGSGVTLITGIGEYDKEGRFGLPSNDFETVQMESKLYNRPDYSEDLFNPDGISRETARLERGLAVIKSHPLWFAGVMLRRAFFMLKYERVPLISPRPTVTHPLTITGEMQPTWSISPEEATSKGVGKSSQIGISLADAGRALRITAVNSKQAQLVTFPEISIRNDTDYVLNVPIKCEHGSATIHVDSLNTGERLASTVTIVPLIDTEKQPLALVRLPFVNSRTDRVTVAIDIGGTEETRVIQIGKMELFALGPSSAHWTYYPRVLIRIVQKFFLTAWMLPLLIIGAGLLAIARQKAALMILCIVPVYYLSSHTLFHTEYRMVLSLHYFYSMLSAVALYAFFLFGQSVRRHVTAKRFKANG